MPVVPAPRRPRRAARRVTRLLAGLWLGAGCRESGAPAAPTDAAPRPALVVGSDVSALARLEAGGAAYAGPNGPGDALGVLRTAGHELFRLRLFVAPSGHDVVVNDVPYTLALARRAQATGAAVLLALHYSDTWADPGQQTVPAPWAGLSGAALEAEVERYTASVLQQFRAAGVTPRIVQLGNEIDDGLLWPQGRLGNATPVARAAFGALLRAAVRGVRQVIASADTTAVMLHYAQGGNAAGAAWFFTQVEAEAVPFDLVGLSFYPWWHGSLAQLQHTIDTLGVRLQRDVYVVETAAPWRADWTPPAGATGPLAFAATPAGQAAYARALAATVASTRRGRGILWWYPEAVPVPGLAVWAGGALSLFSDRGALLPAAAALRGP